MSVATWNKELKRILKKVPYNVVENWDPDAGNRRIPGQLGEYHPDYGNPNDNLCVCIDISEPNNFYEDYAEIIEYLQSLRDIRDKFKRIHLNYWAGDYYLSEPICMRRSIGLFDLAEEYFEKAKESIDTSIALTSNIFKPLTYGNTWYKLKPVLILILTKGIMNNNLEQQHLLDIKQHLNNVVWICLSDIRDIYLSTILGIDSKAESRIVFTKE